MKLKALSVRQPYAQQILTGKKKIEYRSWPTKYRGPLVICSSRTPEKGEPGWSEDLLLGHALGLVQLVDCIEEDFGN